MLRLAALALLLANALLLAAQAGWLDGWGGQAGTASLREPGRLERQVNPGQLSIVAPAAAAGAASAASSASMPSVASPASAASAPPVAATATAAPVGPAASASLPTPMPVPASAPAAAAASSPAVASVACLEAGPMDTAGLAAAEGALREAGLAPGAWSTLAGDTRAGFIVYMGRFADRSALQRKRDELLRLKVPAEELRDPAELQPGLDLGRFDSKASAEAAMVGMAAQGVRTAQVVALRPATSATWLRVVAADAAQQARLAGLRLPPGPGFGPCAGVGVGTRQ